MLTAAPGTGRAGVTSASVVGAGLETLTSDGGTTARGTRRLGEIWQ
jgi:hypothetical protein